MQTQTGPAMDYAGLMQFHHRRKLVNIVSLVSGIPECLLPVNV